MENIDGRICELGCGRPAKFVLKIGKACCERSANSCPEVRRKNGESHEGKCPKWEKGHSRYWIGKRRWTVGKTYDEIYGEERSREIRCKIRDSQSRHTGRASTKEKERQRRARISVAAKENKFGNYGGYKLGAGRGKHGWYKGIWCDSSWELAWVMFNIDHGIKFERNRDKLKYEWKGEIRIYLPDFKMPDGCYVEVKGWMSDKDEAKLAAYPEVKMLMKKDMEPFIEYAMEKYGKDFIRLYDDYCGSSVGVCACGKRLGKTNKSGCCFKCGMRKRRHEDRFCSCGRMVSRSSESGKCWMCVGIGRGRKVERPDMSVLLAQTDEIGFEATGRIYGVSGNAIRKWLKGRVR